MPVTGEVDISGILANLGDPTNGLVAARPPVPGDAEDIFRAAYGTIDMSTSASLAVIPRFVWDVNYYYRTLNIRWPYKPTRKELRLGFQAVDGHSSERTTYYMKQLLNPEVRAEYDAMPLGSRYFDKFTAEESMRKLSDVAKEMSEDQGILVTVDDLMKDFKERPELSELPASEFRWDWGFYAHKSRKYDTTALQSWQALLIAACVNQGVVATISIGYVGKTRKPFVIRHHKDRNIFFLNEEIDHPTVELAETAVSKFRAQGSKGTA